MMRRAKRKIQRDGFLGFLKSCGSLVSNPFSLKPPHTATIEITNTCNLNCVMCSAQQQMREQKQPRRFIAEPFFKNVIDQLAAMRVHTVVLNFGGESLMHPNFLSLMEYAAQAQGRGVKSVGWFDNGMLFSREVSDRAIKCSVDFVIFSLNGLGAANDVPRRGAKYDVIKENISYLLRARGPHGKPQVRINIIDFGDNQKELDEFLHVWVPVVDDIIVSPLQNSDFTCGNRSFYEGSPTYQVPYCPFFFNYVGIIANGHVGACCSDNNAQTMMGDLNRNTLREIWNSPRYKFMRRAAKTGVFPRDMPCVKCDFWKVRFKTRTVTVWGGKAKVMYHENQKVYTHA